MMQHSPRNPATDGAVSRFLAAPPPPVPSGVSLQRDRCRKANVALIDALPLRRACTLHLLREHLFERAKAYAHALEVLAQGSIKPEGFSVVIICAGVRSVSEAPLREQMRRLGRDLASTPIIVMSDREETEEIVAAFREGARGYIPTSLEPHLVIEAIRMVLADVTFVPVEALLRLRREVQLKIERPCVERVAVEHRENWPPRQLAVLRLLVQGRANKEIARALALEESTIKVHVRLIMRKLGVTNRTQAALTVRQLGILVSLDAAPASIMQRPSLPPAPTHLASFSGDRLPQAGLSALPTPAPSTVLPGGGRPPGAR